MSGPATTGAPAARARTVGGCLRLCRGPSARPALLFLAWSLWLALEYVGLGPLSYVPLADHGENNLPARLATALAWQEGEIGFWFPQALMGADRLSMGLQNKTDLLFFFLLPGWLAHGLILWAQRFVAGYFMYRLLAERFGAGALPSLTGGILYALFSQPAINQQWAGFSLYDGLALPALPCVLWALGRILERGGSTGILAAGLAGAGYSLVSHFFYTVFILPLVLLWFPLVEGRKRGLFVVLAAFVLGWVAVEAPFLWASAVQAPLGHRRHWAVPHVLSGNATALWLVAIDLPLALLRDNLPILIAAAAGLLFARQRDRRLLATSALAGACLAYCICDTLFLGGLLFEAGIFPGFNFSRVYIVIPFLFIAAGCLGLEHVPSSWQVRLEGVAGGQTALAVRTLLCLALIGLAGWQSLAIKGEAFMGIADGKTFSNLYRHPALAELQRLRTGQPSFRVATVAGAIRSGPLTGYAWAYGLETADGYIPLYSERYHRFWEAVISPLESHDPAGVDLFRRRGSRAYLTLPAWERLGGQTVRLESRARLNLLSLANVRYIVSAVPLEGTGLHLRAGDFLERQIEWAERPRRDRFLGMILGEYPGTPLYVYENTEVLPRFFLASRVRAFDDPGPLLDALASAPAGELLTTAFVMRRDMEGLAVPAGDNPGGVSVRSLGPDRIELEVDARTASVLTVTSNFNPGWRAWINGIPHRVFPVDHTFLGVAMPAGRHDVVFSYALPFASQGAGIVHGTDRNPAGEAKRARR
ncbi:MAG TPA: DUF6044 family protein [Syntrophales bacterium]|nr:YfhO family protein [Syntrophobacterales bacterium]HQL90887.1 DUF6044 family protein [Syntrophales bacterium]